MKKKIMMLGLSCALVFGGVSAVPATTIVAEAAEMTVTGTIASGSTNQLINLSTNDGTMKVKLDSSTTVTGGKLLLVGKKITANLYHGSDGYWHASSIVADESTTGVTMDTSNTASVAGKVLDGSTDEILKLELTEGTMYLKIDSTTDFSDCSMIAVGQTITAKVARGSDAYMHAISISDGNSTSSSSSSSSDVVRNGETLPNVTGTVSSVSNNRSMLELKLEDTGDIMYIKLDDDMDTDDCPTLLDDQSVMVAVYRGDDAYMHAAKLTDKTVKASSNATLGDSETTVTGTVTKSTTATTLYLSTSGGTMQIKLDASPSMHSTTLIKNYKYSVTVVGGSDGYLHATSVFAQ